jgi:hypothetical protein
MAHSETISKIDLGLAFEDTGMMIPWGTPIERLPEFESPIANRQSNSIHYTWKNRHLFGLVCDVRTCQLGLDQPPDPSIYHLTIPHLHWASLDISADWNEKAGNLDSGFRELFRHFENTFGTPTFCYREYSRGLPAIFWDLPRLRVSYALMSGRPSLSIAHEPKGYLELRNKYAALLVEKGEGARIEYYDFDWPELT